MPNMTSYFPAKSIAQKVLARSNSRLRTAQEEDEKPLIGDTESEPVEGRVGQSHDEGEELKTVTVQISNRDYHNMIDHFTKRQWLSGGRPLIAVVKIIQADDYPGEGNDDETGSALEGGPKGPPAAGLSPSGYI